MRTRAPALPRVKRTLARLYLKLGFTQAGCCTVASLLAFLGWVFMVKLGLAGKPVLVMNCDEGRQADGFYAQFTVILGLLEHYEKWRSVIAGVRVDFGDWNLYYDPAHGCNSWEYYFQPVRIGRDSRALVRVIDFEQGNRFSMRGERMPRWRAHELIARYIHVKPHVAAKIDGFASAHLDGHYVIGVHYRGTDKWTEAPRVPYEEVHSAVRDAIGACRSDRYRLFVASDEQAFVDGMQKAFPHRVVCWDTLRSLDGSPIDFRMGDNYKKGEDAVIDCLLLSRCDRLIRTSSSLGLCSTFFNPDVPVDLLNRHYATPEASSG